MRAMEIAHCRALATRVHCSPKEECPAIVYFALQNLSIIQPVIDCGSIGQVYAVQDSCKSRAWERHLQTRVSTKDQNISNVVDRHDNTGALHGSREF